MRRARPRLLLLLLLSCSGAPARRAPGEGGTRVFRVDRAAQLVGGPVAEGAVGDWRLENDRIALIVSAVGRPTGFSQSGGNIIDAAARHANGQVGADELRHVFLYLNETFLREARYHEATPRTSDDAATLIVRGRDSQDETIALETHYELRAGAATLRIRTRATNLGKAVVPNYRIGDVLAWGAGEHFAPGFGTHFRGRQEMPWLAGAGEFATYGYTGPAGAQLRGLHGSSWSDVTLAAADLRPGGSLEAVRQLAVGADGGVGAVLGDLLALRGEPFGTLRGRVTEARTGQPVAGARVTIDRADGKPAASARSGHDGRYVAALPPGEYRIQMDAPGRSGPRGIVAHVATKGETRADGTLAQRCALDFAITDEGGGPIPVKITALGIPPTPDPMLGSRYRAAGAGNVILSIDGRGSVPLAPGRYRIIATRGLEYDAVEAEVTINAGQPATLRGTLRRVVDTRGFISADLHQHAMPSADSAVPLRDRVLSNAAAGVEILVATDHDFVTDFAPIIAEMGLGRHVRSIPGTEATTSAWGHFNAFPLVPRPDQARNGVFAAAEMTGAEVLARLAAIPSDKIVQVNHPRGGKGGYLNAVSYDPRAPDLPPGMSTSFDAIEILNGKRLDELEPALRDWFSLLSRGMRTVATGNSDTHAVFGEEAGTPRNFVAVADDTPDRVTAAELVTSLRDRKNSLLTTGPFLRVSVAGHPIGSLVRARGRVEVAVEAWAAPWIDLTTVELWRDGALAASHSVPPSDRPLRLQGVLVTDVKRDAFLVVIARGVKPLAPYVSTDEDFAAMPVAITNPIWIDANGNGRFDAPGITPPPATLP